MTGRGGRRLAGPALALALTGSLTGCVDFLEPEPAPTRLNASLGLRDASPAEAVLSAFLSPGATEAPREPLRVWDRSFDPEPPQNGDLLRYQGSWVPDTAVLLGSDVVFEGPALPGGSAGPVVRVPLVWREGPNSVALDTDSDLQLPLRGAPAPLGAGDVASWTLRVRALDSDGDTISTVFSLSASGVPPDTVVVQRDILGSARHESLLATLRTSFLANRDGPDVPYRVVAIVQVELNWLVIPATRSPT